MASAALSLGSTEETIDLVSVLIIVSVVGYLAYELLKTGGPLDDLGNSLSNLWTKGNDALHPQASGTSAPGGYDYIDANGNVVSVDKSAAQTQGAATSAQMVYPTQPVSSLSGTTGVTSLAGGGGGTW